MSFSFDSLTAFNRTVLQIPKDEYPNVDKATAVIIDMGDSVSVGVKMVMFVTRKFEGKETVEAEQFGDYCKVSKDAMNTISQSLYTAFAAATADGPEGHTAP